jgi:hypothetical protein
MQAVIATERKTVLVFGTQRRHEGDKGAMNCLVVEDKEVTDLI